MATATKHEPTEYQDQTVEMLADLLGYLAVGQRGDELIFVESFNIEDNGEFDENGAVIMPIVGNLRVRIGRDAEAGTEFNDSGLF